MIGSSVLQSLPEGRLELQMSDGKSAFDPAGAVAEASRCLYCYDAPCIKACPTEINIPEFIRKIGTGNLTGAARTILSSNILGHSCARVCPVEVLCQGACVYNLEKHPPIEIGRLQRYATDHIHQHHQQLFKKGTASGFNVAVIGGGPAGLACAHELTLRGHRVVIFEARPNPGGLNTSGVAPYKMPAAVSLEEVRYITEIGIELRLGVEVGRDVTREDLERDFDAIFVGVGLGPDGFPKIPGEALHGVVGAVALIEKIKLDPEYSLRGIQRAVVVGGGNTAIDAVRELRKLHVPEVSLLYRRGESEMSAYRHEWAHAKEEGARAIFWAVPEKIYDGGTGMVAGLRCVRTRQDDGHLQPIPDSQFNIAADLVVMAIGQDRLSGLFGDLGLDFRNGRLVVDPVTRQTSNARYFAGGDCVNGGKEVVNAAAEGKAAAIRLDAFLNNKRIDHKA